MCAQRFSRRSLVGAATAALAAETGAHILTSSLFPETATLARIRRAVVSGDGRALADDSLFVKPEHPVFTFTVHAKWESAGWINRPNPQAVGVVGNTACEVSEKYKSLGLTRQFGDYLDFDESKVGCAIIPASTTSGNHAYTGLQQTMDKTGCLSYFVNSALGGLLPLYFASVGTADGSTAVFSPGVNQLITYPTVDAAVSAFMDALTPLRNVSGAPAEVLAALNGRVQQDEALKKSLEALAERLETARKPLQDAVTLANTKPMTNGVGINVLPDWATLASFNPGIPQADALMALMDLGLTSSGVISFANSDPNGGGDHAATGGTNVAHGPRSPNQNKMCVAQTISHIFKRYPGAIITLNTDGGRTAGGGDSQPFECFLFGPLGIVNTVFVNAASRDDSSKFGTNPQPVKLSDGSSMVPNEAHIGSTAAKAAGINMPTPYIPEVLKAG